MLPKFCQAGLWALDVADDGWRNFLRSNKVHSSALHWVQPTQWKGRPCRECNEFNRRPDFAGEQIWSLQADWKESGVLEMMCFMCCGELICRVKGVKCERARTIRLICDAGCGFTQFLPMNLRYLSPILPIIMAQLRCDYRNYLDNKSLQVSRHIRE